MRNPCRWVNQGARYLQWGDSPEEMPGGNELGRETTSQGMLGSGHLRLLEGRQERVKAERSSNPRSRRLQTSWKQETR